MQVVICKLLENIGAMLLSIDLKSKGIILIHRSVDHNETREDSPWIENDQLLEIRVDPGLAHHRVIRPTLTQHGLLFSRHRVITPDSPNSPSYDPTHQHGPPALIGRHVEAVVGPTAAGRGPDPLAREPMPYDGAHAARGKGPTQGRCATCAERAS